MLTAKQTIAEVNNIFLEIENTSSTKEKQLIITANCNSTLFKDVLNHFFNPFLKTNIARKKLSKNVDKSIGVELSDVYEYMEYLSQSTGKDEHIATVQRFIESQPEELHWLLDAMAIKKIKIGVTGKSVNKALGENFIPQFNVMLAEKYIDEKKDGRVIENFKEYDGKDVIVTKKIDGYRCAVFVRESGISFYSREGNDFEELIELHEEFKNFPTGFVYDGELLATNEEGLNTEDLFKKTGKILKKKGEKTGLLFNAFDIIPIPDFENGYFEIDCINRKEALTRVIDMYSNGKVLNVDILYYGKFDTDIIQKFSDEAESRGDEGIMVQLANAPYECKRTKKLLKVKVFQSADVLCTGVYEGLSDSTKGSLGGLILDYRGYQVKVGGGYTQEDRQKYWENPELVIGKIIEIKYFKEFMDEDGTLDLRFATFKTIRDDKTEPSYY